MSSRKEGLHVPSRRKIDTWVHKIRVGPDVREYKIAISLLSNDAGEMKFEALSSDWGFPREVTSADINDLRRQVESRISAMDLGDGLEWTDYLKIAIEGNDNSYSDKVIAQHLKLSYEHVRCARLSNGDLYYLDGANNPRKAHIESGQRMDLFGKGLIDAHGSSAFIPATPENVSAMDDIMDKIRQLRIRLAELMAQERISALLQQVSVGLPLLLENATKQSKPTSRHP